MALLVACREKTTAAKLEEFKLKLHSMGNVKRQRVMSEAYDSKDRRQVSRDNTSPTKSSDDRATLSRSAKLSLAEEEAADSAPLTADAYLDLDESDEEVSLKDHKFVTKKRPQDYETYVNDFLRFTCAT